VRIAGFFKNFLAKNAVMLLSSILKIKNKMSMQITKYGNALDYKIANLLVYLAQKINKLSTTKTIKLLYLIDEAAVKKFGTPITWLEYKVWNLGPVPDTIYNQITNLKIAEPFSNFLSIEQVDKKSEAKNPQKKVSPKKYFDDSEFSDAEMLVIDEIIEEYGNCTATKLVDILHAPGGLWEQTKKDKNIKFGEKSKTTDEIMDFRKLIADDTFKLMVYESVRESLLF
jgi:uncharacterized phage-associated protein